MSSNVAPVETNGALAGVLKNCITAVTEEGIIVINLKTDSFRFSLALSVLSSPVQLL